MDFEGAFYNTTDYKLTNKKLGEGAFGKVYIIQSLKDKRNYAVKIINTDSGFNGTEQMQLMRESMILHKLDHPGIVKYIGINFQSLTNREKLEPSIITEYLPNGSLKEILDNEKNSLADYNWTPTKKYIQLLGIVHAMRYLHEHSIIHRDLKPQNILIDSDYYPRVCDFGLSRCLPDSLTKSTNLSMTKEIGTPLYMAPELIGGDSHYDSSVDVYSFAILAYEIVTGKEPYYELGKVTSFKLANKVMKGYRPKFTKNVTKKMKNLLSRCWDENISERPTFDEIYKLLSTDFSYFDDDVDEDEINQYIDDIEDECKRSNKTQKEVNFSSSSSKKHENYEISDYKIYNSLNCLLGNQYERNPYLASHNLKTASKDGNCLASYIVGLLYESGTGFDKDIQKAQFYYERSADQGNSYGLFKLGLLHYEDNSSEKDYSEAVEYFQKGSNIGNPLATTYLGFCYEDGKGVEEDKSKALELYHKALDQGSEFAINTIGYCYRFGIGCDTDYDKAMEMFQKGESLKHAVSIHNIGQMYEKGQGVRKDYTIAVRYYEKSAKYGCPFAYGDLGNCYEKGMGVNVNNSKAIEYYTKGGELSNIFSLNQLAYMYSNGIGVEKDLKKAFELYSKSSLLGSAHGTVNVGFFYENGNGVQQDYKKAFEYYQKAASGGESCAYRLLGEMYKDGRGVQKDYTQAVEYFRKAIDKDDIIALRLLGVCYESGYGVSKDCSKANEYYQKAADEGDITSVRFLAMNYEQGIGFKQNYEKARELYLKAAENGEYSCYHRVAVMYENGNGVKKNVDKALSYYQKAAEKGYSDSYAAMGLIYFNGNREKGFGCFKKAADMGSPSGCYLTGLCYQDGTGVTKDRSKALEYFRKADKLGYDDAKEKLKSLIT